MLQADAPLTDLSIFSKMSSTKKSTEPIVADPRSEYINDAFDLAYTTARTARIKAALEQRLDLLAEFISTSKGDVGSLLVHLKLMPSLSSSSSSVVQHHDPHEYTASVMLSALKQINRFAALECIRFEDASSVLDARAKEIRTAVPCRDLSETEWKTLWKEIKLTAGNAYDTEAAVKKEAQLELKRLTDAEARIASLAAEEARTSAFREAEEAKQVAFREAEEAKLLVLKEEMTRLQTLKVFEEARLQSISQEELRLKTERQEEETRLKTLVATEEAQLTALKAEEARIKTENEKQVARMEAEVALLQSNISSLRA